MTLRVLISGGGTGGHIYPCLTVARSLASGQDHVGGPGSGASTVRFLYIGGPRPIDRRLVEEAGLPFEAVEVGGLRGMGLEAIKNAARLPAGLTRTIRLMRAFDPSVVILSGGYVSAPVVAASVLLRVPLVVLTVEIDQGWVNMAAARVAAAVTASFPPALAHLPPDRTTLTGYPAREEFLNLDKAQARSLLNLDPAMPVVAAFGGSQGARRINEAVAGALPALLAEAQVVHVCGEQDLVRMQERQAALPEELRGRYRLYQYLPAREMAAMQASADLVVCRAGASPLAELPLAGAPAIMVPGPFSSQATNAEYMRDQGAAVVIADARLTPEALQEQVLRLLHDPAQLQAMAEKMRTLAKPDAASAIAALVRRVAGVGHP